jgi:propionyl-CoA carboxylase alpha chain
MRPPRALEFVRERTVELGASQIDIAIEDGEGALVVRFGEGRLHRVASDWTPAVAVWKGTLDGQPYAVQVRPIANGFRLDHAGVSVEARVYTRREAEFARLMPEKKVADTSKTLLCPMPGLVKAILVKEGQEAKIGEPLCIVEAMKMENVLRAERDVTISRLRAAPGDSLAVDAVIMEFA